MNRLFDRLADATAEQVARAWFCAFCAVLVLSWVIGLPFAGWDNDIYHLGLNSPTTAITFLLVALLHNTQHRTERALHHKLDVILQALCERVEDPELVEEMHRLIGREAEPSKEE